MVRRIETAEVLAVGSELTRGETRDTNSGVLARALTELGVDIVGTAQLPDRFDIVRQAIAGAIARADLVVTTGGLGPTPDDLTREAIAAVCGEAPHVDAEQESWLRSLFERRGTPMADSNLKQAWLIPSARALPNANGTAPGWWVETPDDRLIAALPGPPRELQPMWHGEVMPRLRARGIGREVATETLRLTGIGESQLVALIGDRVLRSDNPEVATYTREDAVDVRITAVGDEARAVTAAALLSRTVATLEMRLRAYVFARGAETWSDALGRALGERTLATAEDGTAGELVRLLGATPWLVLGEVRRAANVDGDDPAGRLARLVRGAASADLGLAVVARERGADTLVHVAVADERNVQSYQRTAFLSGEQGRRRAALAACTLLWQHLREGAAR